MFAIKSIITSALVAGSAITAGTLNSPTANADVCLPTYAPVSVINTIPAYCPPGVSYAPAPAYYTQQPTYCPPPVAYQPAPVYYRPQVVYTTPPCPPTPIVIRRDDDRRDGYRDDRRIDTRVERPHFSVNLRLGRR